MTPLITTAWEASPLPTPKKLVPNSVLKENKSSRLKAQSKMLAI